MKHIERRRQNEKINYLSVRGLQPRNEPVNELIHVAVQIEDKRSNYIPVNILSANRPIELLKNCFEISASLNGSHRSMV